MRERAAGGRPREIATRSALPTLSFPGVGGRRPPPATHAPATPSRIQSPAGLGRRRIEPQQPSSVDSQAANETGGWSGSFLHKRADANLTEAVELRSLATPFVRCDGTFAFKLSNQAAHQLAVGFKGEDVKGQLLTGLALHLPCR